MKSFQITSRRENYTSLKSTCNEQQKIASKQVSFTGLTSQITAWKRSTQDAGILLGSGCHKISTRLRKQGMKDWKGSCLLPHK